MLDRFTRGRTERISPEAPVPVLSVESEDDSLGGAGNVARNLVALGIQTRFVGIIGNDVAGRRITALMGKESLAEPHLVVATTRMTTVKHRYLADGQQLLRADCETTTPIEGSLAEEFCSLALSALRGTHALILSDYGKGTLSADVIRALTEAAKTEGLPVICDPKGRDFTRYAHADLLTPNRFELALSTGMPTTTSDQVSRAARSLLEKIPLGAILCTRGSEGMSLIDRETALHLPTSAREVYDVSGAGDTVVAILAASLAIGIPRTQAIMLANCAAGIVVAKPGPAVISPADLTSFSIQKSATHKLQDASQKILERQAGLARVAAWRKDGYRIGFTNGCFDLLHPGHIALLRQARMACDRLIVALNDDESVRRLKGPSRPLNDFHARSEVLAELASVDMVLSFSEDTPLALIEMISPDLLAKGSDYQPETIIGSEIVRNRGGQVMIVDLMTSYSTTAIVNRAADRHTQGGGS